MSWAGRRKALIITVASMTLLAVLAIIGFAVFYQVPSCSDGKQNQDERGIDCGGACSLVCTADVGTLPIVNFVRPTTPQPGRTDIIAYIENRNTNAEAEDAPFLLEVHDAQGRVIATKTVTVDLPAATVVPFYAANVAPRGTEAGVAFLTPKAESIIWTRPPASRPVLPSVSNIAVTEGDAPRITATLVNPFAEPVYNTVLVATVFDVSGNAMAASQTLVPTLPSQGTSPLIFTWNAPFAASVARYEILPVPRVGGAP
ncbi:MAG TPA: hypothetical protein VGB97_03270 [Candidatus Paceibacterota bacterium]|jgi:hypothetical protein